MIGAVTDITERVTAQKKQLEEVGFVEWFDKSFREIGRLTLVLTPIIAVG